MLGALSISVITNQAAQPTHAIQTVGFPDFTPSKLCGNSTHFPNTVYAKTLLSGNKTILFFARRKQNLRPRIVLFAVSKESDEPGNGGSQYCTDDPMLTAPTTDGSSKELQKESNACSLDLGAELPQNAKNLGDLEYHLDKLKAVLLHVLAIEQWNASRLKACHGNCLVSATNLMHYLALKSLDIEQLKKDLSSIGLLNLETVNLCVLASLSAGIQMLTNSLNGKKSIGEAVSSGRSLDEQKEFTINSMMKRTFFNRELLLGPLLDERATHIMVTVGQEAAESETFIDDLLKMGTTVIRINCAHGDPGVWSEIVRRVKRSSQMLEKPCRILMDLAGPKLRTGNLKAGPRVMKVTPKKNAHGNVIYPAHVWLSPQGSGPPPAHISPDAVLYVDGQQFLSKLEVGDDVRFFDARGKQRTLKILNKFPIFSGVGFMTECSRTAYVQSGTELFLKKKKRKLSTGFVVDVPSVEQYVRLRVGDLLIISRDISTVQNESTSSNRVTCPSGYLFDSVKPGEPIAFDDGKIWGVIKGVSISEIIVSITHASPKGTKLGSEKSINIPESNIRFEGLTSKDLMNLDFVATHADMVGISFVRDVRDIVMLHQELANRKLWNLGIVLKIETKAGFENLPLMLLEAMKSPNPVGVMIARGDLAVECGWERLADIQEEIISICSAAHVPVIWATQVLESLVKSGVPTRAEITDVANGRRASCIMLNKGKHILEAVATLDNILNGRSTKVKAELKPLVLSSQVY